MAKEPYLAHSELTHEIYIVSGRNKYLVTDQAVKAVKAIQALSQEPTEKPMTVDEMEREYEKSKALFHKIVECEDAISRDMALEKMADYVASGYADSAEDFEEYSRIICQLPSVTQKSGKWFPVSERLPEVNQRVLVTSYGRVCYAMMTSADGNSGHPVFRLQDSLNERVVCETTVHSEFTTSRIIAWMPLPKPYEPQESEEA